MRSNAKDGKVIFSVVSRISQTCDVLVKGLAEDAFTGIFSGAKSADVAQLVEQLIRNSRRSFAPVFAVLRSVFFRADLRLEGLRRIAELRTSTVKIVAPYKTTVERSPIRWATQAAGQPRMKLILFHQPT
jgi:hypothetical protein